MPNVIKPKRSSVGGNNPTTSNLASGEMGVNMADQKIWINNGTSVVQIGAGKLTSLADVSVSSPSSGQVLSWNGTNWVNTTNSAAGVSSFNTRTGAVTLSSGDVTGALGYTPYNSTNPNGYTSNTGTVTSVSGTGSVAGLSLSGSVTTSGSLSLSGTLSASIDNITDEHRLFNNMGDNHGTRSSFDAQGAAASVNFGWRYVQGSTNGPGTNSAGQYYSAFVGLGNEYAYNTYGMQMAIPRNVSSPYLSVRYEEGGAFGAWNKISAGYADSAGSVAWTNVSGRPTAVSSFTNDSGYITSSGNAATATNLSTNRTNWSSNGTISAVVGQMAWKNYGNSHTIFDASNGTAPDGSAVNNTNAQVAWSGSYPTLMGWNGANTFGVRVDSARVADTVAASGISGQTGMYTSSNRPGAYRLYRNDSDDPYNIQTTWSADRSGYWSLRGYYNDSYHAACYVAYSGYADSAASATTAANVSASSDQAIVNQHNGSASSWYGRILSKNSTSNKAAFLGTYGTIAGVFAHNNALSAWDDLYVNTVDGSGGGNVRLPSTTYINGSQSIHAGNVGSYAIPYVAPSTAGNVLTSNGSSWVSSPAASGGQFFGSAVVKAIAYNANSISENITITAGNNGLSAGPITINTGYTVTVATGAAWVIV